MRPRYLRRPPRPLKRVGYWWSPEEPLLPHPRDYVDLSWDEGERQDVVAYLQSAYYLYGWMGFSWCRFGCPEGIGAWDMTDGTWLFPEGLAHYVAKHAVKPRPEFLEHIRQAGFRMPELPEAEPLVLIGDLAQAVRGILNDYIRVHNELFGGRFLRTLRRLVPIPGFFKVITPPNTHLALARPRHATRVDHGPDRYGGCSRPDGPHTRLLHRSPAAGH